MKQKRDTADDVLPGHDVSVARYRRWRRGGSAGWRCAQPGRPTPSRSLEPGGLFAACDDPGDALTGTTDPDSSPGSFGARAPFGKDLIGTQLDPQWHQISH